MVETYKSQPLEERPSQKVGWSGYLKEVAIGLIPFATAGAAIAFGKFTKQKIFPLDGSPDILSSLWMKITQKTANSRGASIKIDQTDWVWWLTAPYKKYEDKLRVSQHYFNALKGFEFGAIPVIFYHWRKSEKKRLDLTSTYEQLKSVNTLKPTDDELKAENASLRQQLEFVRSQPEMTLEAKSGHHQGTIHADGPAQNISV